ncbi:MAG: hypothetical protein WCG19_04955 [Chlorobiaceae bacterium]
MTTLISIGIVNQDNHFYGYSASQNMKGTLVTSNNVFDGGDLTGPSTGAQELGVGRVWNAAIGGAYCMYDKTVSRYNILTGGSSYTTFNGSNVSVLNEMMGTAGTMFGFSSGGYNTLIGGDAKNVNGSFVWNTLEGTAFSMNNSSTGGHNTLMGGDNFSATGGLVTNYLFGDSQIKSDHAAGGYNTIIAGTGINGNGVINQMWGDAITVLGTTTTGGHDLFIFADNGTASVGTQNYIYDFSQAVSDHIEFSHIDGVTRFSDLVITQSGGSTIIHAGSDAVTLVGFSGSLQASDFIFHAPTSIETTTSAGIDNQNNHFYGYSAFKDMHGNIESSYNVYNGGNNTAAYNGTIGNELTGGAYCMYDNTTSQYNILTGGNNYSSAVDSNWMVNAIQGTAGTMFGSSSGGYNTLTGGNAKNVAGSFIWNTLCGNAFSMYISSTGGHNKLKGGDNFSAIGGMAVNCLYGDSNIKNDNAAGGYNTLIAGTGINGNGVINKMWGDAANLSGTPAGGHDLFIFSDNGNTRVGTQNYIYDFSQAVSDHIEFSHINGVTGFSNLVISQSGGNTIIKAGSDAVTLVGFSGSLKTSDFIFF